MTFALSEDQEALRSTVERSFTDLCSSQYVRSFADDEKSYGKLWQLVESLGLFEYFADSQIPLADLALISYEAGKVLLPSVVTETLYFGPFSAARNLEYPNKDLSKRVCVGISTDDSSVSFISDADASFAAVIKPFAESSKHLQLIPIERSLLRSHTCLDLTRRSASLSLTEGAVLPEADAKKIIYGYMVLIAAELSGLSAKVIAMTREYSLTRKQFGVQIGSFQAVQQQLAESYLKAEGMWALTQFAASVFSYDPVQLPLAARSALSYAVKSAPVVCETALQLHGGIGFTWEYDMHLYLRRAQTLASLYALGEDDERAILEDAATI